MKNWKISKLQIQAFKAFTNIEFDFNKSSLITLEGPNGYGKTSTFDAIELLFTGKISRISDLYKLVMVETKKKFKDNLYWNKKSGEVDLKIKVELMNDHDDEKLFFVRMGFVNDLKVEINNKANNFDIFSLYKLDDFNSEPTENKLENNFFEQFFGESFCSNYSMLNYLHQGQSQFIFSKKITDRKKALEELIKTTEIKKHIDVCNKTEIKLTKLAKEKKIEIDEIDAKLKNILEKNISQSEYDVTYKKISTQRTSPKWDDEEIFLQEADVNYNNFIKEIELLIECCKRKEDIRIRNQNSAIEKFIIDNDSSLLLLVSIGKYISKFENLQLVNKKLSEIDQILIILDKDFNAISQEEITKLSSLGVVISDKLQETIIEKDNKLALLSERKVKLLELNKMREDLFEKHKQSFGEDSTICALCGVDWESVEKLIENIRLISELYVKEIGSSTEDLSKVYLMISSELSLIKELYIKEKDAFLKDFNINLFTKLNVNQNFFETLNSLSSRLEKMAISYSSEYTDDDIELKIRKDKIISNLRDLKKIEGDVLPIGWEEAISVTFEKNKDFYDLLEDDLNHKKNYVNKKFKEFKDSELQQTKKLLKEKSDLYNANLNAKAKIIRLKKTLTETERDYSSRIIANIELIFHIYSGRLIQNYQRGLGLFIDYAEGQQIRFCTAESSDHDATLAMSSGQLAALSLAFFLSLNRVYSENSLVLIDDPVQSLDEINIASLTDLLRCELKDRQLIISSHEDDISRYMRYRFERAGLSQVSIHMQNHNTDNVIQRN
ncbi:AAA family ATPase [Acinetobacter wuhouensis]|uniref:ATP-binding protein n=1 Tax=Acinetobacter wuhouensis TaxID=1879050 RepID=UPI00083AF70B|nr:AAA family ATPase [Acinetobacter wuhouensis]AXQ21267.1 AAA family ATPase [Acinetobacter wuhouensis]